MDQSPWEQTLYKRGNRTGFWEGSITPYRYPNIGLWERSFGNHHNEYGRSNQIGHWTGSWEDLQTRTDQMGYWQGDIIPYRGRDIDFQDGFLEDSNTIYRKPGKIELWREEAAYYTRRHETIRGEEEQHRIRQRGCELYRNREEKESNTEDENANIKDSDEMEEGEIKENDNEKIPQKKRIKEEKAWKGREEVLQWNQEKEKDREIRDQNDSKQILQQRETKKSNEEKKDKKDKRIKREEHEGRQRKEEIEKHSKEINKKEIRQILL